MKYRPLMMMRTRGLMGPIACKYANLKTHVAKSVGAFHGDRPELVTNGSFSEGTTGWTGLEVVDGVARTLDTTAYQVISTEAGTEYRLRLDCDAKGVSPQCQVQNGAVTGSPPIAELNPSGNIGMQGYSTTFIALGPDSIVVLSNGSNTALWDNISIKRVA